MRSARITRLFAAALVATAVPAAADSSWTPVAQTGESVYLLDEASIEVRAGLLTAWELVEYAWPQYADGVGYRSQVNLRAYRCAERSWDVLQVTRFAGPGRSGEAVLSSRFVPSVSAWHAAPPESVAAHLLDRVCRLAGRGHASSAASLRGSSAAAI